jgi:hypothetical protein
MHKAFIIVFSVLCGSAPAPVMAQTEATQETTQPEKSASTNIVSGLPERSKKHLDISAPHQSGGSRMACSD